MMTTFCPAARVVVGSEASTVAAKKLRTRRSARVRTGNEGSLGRAAPRRVRNAVHPTVGLVAEPMARWSQHPVGPMVRLTSALGEVSDHQQPLEVRDVDRRPHKC